MDLREVPVTLKIKGQIKIYSLIVTLDKIKKILY